jgi:insulysin
LFGHEGENSLLSYLISEGLALELSSSCDHELWSFSTFSVDITLTKKGLENHEKVIEALFQYAQRIKDAGPQEYIFDECKDLGLMQFEF